MSHLLPELSDREARARRHVAYTYLLEECLSKDPRSDLYLCPSLTHKLVVMYEMEKVFDYDLRFVPGFYYDTRTRSQIGWMLNVPDEGFVRPARDKAGAITALHYLKTRGAGARLVTSKGLCLGS